MQTIFEIFNPVDGKTEGYKTRESADTFIARMERAGFIRDFLPATGEGFYVVDMRGNVKAGPFEDKRAAMNKSDMENMASDTNSFSVVEHRL